jgi:hypothetical protein
VTPYLYGFTLILTEALNGLKAMLNLRIPPKTPEELYKFFAYGLPLPPVRSHVAYIEFFKYIRENWVTTGYLSENDDSYRFWFRYNESDSPRYYEVYEKYIHDETTKKHK